MFIDPLEVSTHSRLKAAGALFFCYLTRLGGFNTQPPEGGWQGAGLVPLQSCRFNTQPPEGGWTGLQAGRFHCRVSTHSRLKAAGSHSFGTK